MDARLYFPEEWANDSARQKKLMFRTTSSFKFQTKPQIALDLIDRAKANGVEVIAWTADELYGRDGAFLDGLDQRNEAFVIEVPPNAHVWLMKPNVLKTPPQNATGRPKKYPR